MKMNIECVYLMTADLKLVSGINLLNFVNDGLLGIFYLLMLPVLISENSTQKATTI